MNYPFILYPGCPFQTAKMQKKLPFLFFKQTPTAPRSCENKIYWELTELIETHLYGLEKDKMSREIPEHS